MTHYPAFKVPASEARQTRALVVDPYPLVTTLDVRVAGAGLRDLAPGEEKLVAENGVFQDLD